MSIVVFDPDSVEDVDFADRMRHPAAADPGGGMWLSDTEPSFVDADALRKGRLEEAARMDARGRLWRRRAVRPVQPALCHRLAQHVRLFPAQLDPLFLHSGRRADRPVRISAELPCLDGARHGRRGAAVQAGLVVGVGPRRRDGRSLRRRDRRSPEDAWRRLDEARARPLRPSAGAGAGEARLRGQGLPGRDTGRARGQDAGGGEMPPGLDGRRGGCRRGGAGSHQAGRLGERSVRHHVP